MGSKKLWHIIWVMFFLCSCSRLAQAMNNNSYDPDSLDDFIRGYALNNVSRPRTGILYEISLPANFSGMEVSLLRIRTRRFWLNGTNLSYFHIPPRLLPMPFVRRFYLVYQNLGNWSSYYYNVPNYTLITPVVGLMFYNASTNLSAQRNSSRLDLCVNRDPILVHFPVISLPQNKNVTMQCVRFGTNGSVELTNMSVPNTCIARNHGHFGIVVPLPPRPGKKKDRFLKWWVMGFGLGIFGLVLVAVLVVLGYKFVKRKGIVQMERESERSEALDTTWVGVSRMPSASGIRTQPTIENDYVP